MWNKTTLSWVTCQVDGWPGGEVSWAPRPALSLTAYVTPAAVAMSLSREGGHSLRVPLMKWEFRGARAAAPVEQEQHGCCLNWALILHAAILNPTPVILSLAEIYSVRQLLWTLTMC